MTRYVLPPVPEFEQEDHHTCAHRTQRLLPLVAEWRLSLSPCRIPRPVAMTTNAATQHFIVRRTSQLWPFKKERTLRGGRIAPRNEVDFKADSFVSLLKLTYHIRTDIIRT